MRLYPRKYQVVEPQKEEPKPKLATDRKSKFVWTKGADVMKTWKRHGFVPPTEYRNDYLFKKNREHTDE